MNAKSPSEEYYEQQSEEEKPKALLAMGIGLKDTHHHASLLSSSRLKLNKTHYLKEAQRRHELLKSPRNPTFTFSHPKPNNGLIKEEIISWLEKNPVKDAPSLSFIHGKLESTNCGLGSASTSTLQGNGSSRASLPSSREFHDSTAQTRSYSKSLDNGNPPVRTYNLVHQPNPKEIMVQALGIVGCDYGQEPFQSRGDLFAPTKQMVVDEVERRAAMWGTTLQDVLLDWLRKHPIRNRGEVQNLWSQVNLIKGVVDPAGRYAAGSAQDNGRHEPPTSQQRLEGQQQPPTGSGVDADDEIASEESWKTIDKDDLPDDLSDICVVEKGPGDAEGPESRSPTNQQMPIGTVLHDSEVVNFGEPTGSIQSETDLTGIDLVKDDLFKDPDDSSPEEHPIHWDEISSVASATSSARSSHLTAESSGIQRLRGGGLTRIAETNAVNDRYERADKVPSGSQDKPSQFSSTPWTLLPLLSGKESTTSVSEMQISDWKGNEGKFTGQCRPPAPGQSRLLPHGQGDMKYNTGLIYEGEWRMGVWHGEGKLVYREKVLYKGEFGNGTFSGEGRREWRDGSVYKGNWKNGKRSGSGKFSSATGDVYEGSWVNDIRHGPCRYTNKRGKTYHGHWESNRLLPDNARYDGLWKDGKPHVYGVYHFVTGTVYEGEVRDGVIEGFGRYVYTRGGYYEGKLLEAKASGFGKRVWSNGQEYKGEWLKDKPHGKGTGRWSTGDTYQGEFHCGLKHGTGRYTLNGGAILHDGEWKNDRPVARPGKLEFREH